MSKHKNQPRENYSYSTHIPLQKSAGKQRMHKAVQHHQKDFKLMHAPHSMQSILRDLERHFFLKQASKILGPLFCLKFKLHNSSF